MGSFLAGVNLRDPTVYLAVTLILAGVSFRALWIPACNACTRSTLLAP